MNPLVIRYFESAQKTKAFAIYSALYLFALLVFGLWSTPNFSRAERLGGESIAFFTTFYSLLWMAQMVLFAWAAVQTSREIPKEVANKSYDFFRLLPLSPLQKALGLCVGVNLPVLLLLGVNFVLLTVTSVLSKIGVLAHVLLSSLSLSFGLALVCGALLLSTTGAGQRVMAGGRMLRLLVVMLLAMTTVPALIGLTAALSDAHADALTEGLPFFAFELPFWLSGSVVQLYLAAWFFVGGLRRLRYEDAPLVSRSGGLFFLAGTEFFALAFLWPGQHSETMRWSTYFLHLLTSGSLVLAIFLAARASVMDYLEERKRLQRPLSDLWPVVSNLSTAGLFYLIPLASVLLHAFLSNTYPSQSFVCLLLAAMSYVFFAMLAELYTLFEGRPHANVLLGFVVFLYVVFPGIASITLDPQVLVMSSVDMLFWMAKETGERPDLSLLAITGAVHLVYFAGLGWMLLRRYAQIARLAERLG